MQCRDESGKIVDWYVVYKFPRIAGAKSPLDSGFKYAFITSDSKSSWALSNISVTDGEKSIFGQTLHSVYATKLDSNLSYINYNDEPPNGETVSTFAHAKGLVATDDAHGFWLIHSVPHFASDEETHKYEYPSTGGRYGQTALCISFKISEVNKVIEQLLYMEPKIYSMKVSPDLEKHSTNVMDLKNSKWITGGHNSNINNIVSTAGVSFTSFSKNSKADVDLYANIVAPTLKTSLYVETWRKNPGTPLPSECNLSFHVENVHQVSPKFTNSAETAAFVYTDDHSKWALSQTSTHPYICIGDINRMHSQYKRGGGTTCFQSPTVWDSFKQWITETEKC